jgi:hypothetical protein
MHAYDVHVSKARSIHDSELGEYGLRTISLPYYVKYCSIYGFFRNFSTDLLDGGEWKASRHDHFTLRERVSSALYTEDCVGLELVWMLCRRKKSLSPAGNQTPIFLPSSPLFGSSLYLPTDLSGIFKNNFNIWGIQSFFNFDSFHKFFRGLMSGLPPPFGRRSCFR